MPDALRWSRVGAAWLLIDVAETLHGVLRGLLLVPLLGDFPARQVGVAIGSLIVLAIAYATVRWMGARTLWQQVAVGLAWVVGIVAFEIALGRLLGYSWSRLLEDYDLRRGGLMGFGLLVLVCAPWITARLRKVPRRPLPRLG